MGIDTALFWINLFLFFFESKYTKQLISKKSSKACKYHGVSGFIGDLCAINDGKEFLTSCRNIYPKNLELKVEHQANYAPFSDLVMKIEDIFIHKLFDKRDQLNINFLYVFFSGLHRIARCTLRITDSTPRASDFSSRMIAQVTKRPSPTKQLKKAFHRYPVVFQKFNKTFKKNNDSIMKKS